MSPYHSFPSLARAQLVQAILDISLAQLISQSKVFVRGVGYQDGPISAYNQIPFFVRCIDQCVYFIVLYRTSSRKPYILRFRQLEVRGVTMYDNG